MEQETQVSEYQELRDRAVTAAKERAHDVVKIVAAIGALLISIGLAYGTLSGKTLELDKRIELIDDASRERDLAIKADLEKINRKLDTIEGYLRNGSNRPVNHP